MGRLTSIVNLYIAESCKKSKDSILGQSPPLVNTQ